MVSGNTVAIPPATSSLDAWTDTHIHVVSDDVSAFPRRAGGPGRDWWTGRAVDGDALVGDLDVAGVARAVVVQAVGAYGSDNRYARSVVDTWPDRLVLVPAVDLEGTDPAAELVVLMEEGYVAGVRLFGVGVDASWLSDGRGRAIWELAAVSGVTIVPTLFPGDLPALRALAGQIPEAQVALDHCGFPDLRSGPPYQDAPELFALAHSPSIHLKLTSVVLRDASFHGGATPLAERLLASFGPDRLCWGSDHPQTYELTYPGMLALAWDALRTTDDDTRQSVLNGTARRLFWRDEQ
jgi:L-fuconolactonase